MLLLCETYMAITCILQECLLEFLASKTVIYVTHHVEFLPSADLILVSQ
jgi:ABC-type bacteriocin/lantibiotic exporter with double-glycine peptidase domain